MRKIFTYILVLFVFFYAPDSYGAAKKIYIKTKKGAVPFIVEVVKTPDKLASGLMFRESLPENRGMLFDFGKEKVRQMWMKNTLLPLDMIFIKRSGRIVKISENTEPKSLDLISSEDPVRFVLEINGGLCQRLGIKKGDYVRNIFR